MFPFSERELEERELAARESEPKKEWKPQGFFKQRPMTPRERALRAESARLWLQHTLSEPMPAREVFKLAERDKVPIKGLKRAKRRLKVRSVKVGGKQQGWGAQWIWQVPVSK